VKILIPAVFLALGCGTASGQEASSWLGRPDCRVAPVHPVPDTDLSWTGKCQDGYADGNGVLTWRGGQKSQKYRLEATLARGSIQGEATLTMPDGGKYKGTFKDGVPDGRGYFEDPDGMQYEGEVKNGRREGLAEGLFPIGNDYKGQWKDGKPDGVGRMEYKLGGAYEGEWKLGKRHGKGTLTYAGSGRQYVGQFVDGEIAGSTPPPESKETFSLKSNVRWIPSSQGVYAYGADHPLDVGYDALTPEQKRRFNDTYPALEEGDEPPYPLHGAKEFYVLMQRVTGRFWGEGDLRIFVHVNADGSVQSVEMSGLQNDKVRRYAGYAAGLIKYKPAMCRGKPCPMVYPYSLRLTLD
jgi:hypothetical protein